MVSNRKKYNLLNNLNEKPSINYILGSLVIALLAITVSCFFDDPWKDNDNWRIIIVTLLSTIATVCIANIGWEAKVKEVFARDILDMVDISRNIVNSGIVTVYPKFSELEWDDLLKSARDITAVMTYSTTWGKENMDLIKQAVINGCQFTVILPDYDNERVIDNLKFRFGDDINVKSRIIDAKKTYSDLGAKILLYNGTFQNSYYIVDNFGIMASFNHLPRIGEHSPDVPVIKAIKPGSFFNYITEEVQAIKKNSKEIEE
jgi:hypothetical protein